MRAATSVVWDAVAGGRRAIAAEVDRIVADDPDALDAPSRCEGWRCVDVLAHLVHLAEASTSSMARDLVRRGPGPDRGLRRSAVAVAEAPPAELTARLRAAAPGRFRVPGAPPVVALGELVVHAGDLLDPLGIDGATVVGAPAAALADLLVVYRRIGRVAFGRPRPPVSLVADDLGVRVGAGPEVRGRAVDLVTVLAGRRGPVVERLQGPGLDRLA